MLFFIINGTTTKNHPIPFDSPKWFLTRMPCPLLSMLHIPIAVIRLWANRPLHTVWRPRIGAHRRTDCQKYPTENQSRSRVDQCDRLGMRVKYPPAQQLGFRLRPQSNATATFLRYRCHASVGILHARHL